MVAGGPKDPFDLNKDNAVDFADRKMWLHDLKKTWVGDVDLSGTFDSQDFVLAFQAGKYEVPAAAATWVQGDWDGDQFFTSADFVAAFFYGGYEVGPCLWVSAVPEPMFTLPDAARTVAPAASPVVNAGNVGCGCGPSSRSERRPTRIHNETRCNAMRGTRSGGLALAARAEPTLQACSPSYGGPSSCRVGPARDGAGPPSLSLFPLPPPRWLPLRPGFLLRHPQNNFRLSSSSVTGPSLTSSTCMNWRKRPHSTAIPDSRTRPTNVSYNSSAASGSAASVKLGRLPADSHPAG